MLFGGLRSKGASQKLEELGDHIRLAFSVAQAPSGGGPPGTSGYKVHVHKEKKRGGPVLCTSGRHALLTPPWPARDRLRHPASAGCKCFVLGLLACRKRPTSSLPPWQKWAHVTKPTLVKSAPEARPPLTAYTGANALILVL